MNAIRSNVGFWVGGIVAAGAGVVVARGLAPHAARSWSIGLTLGGQLLALAGLMLICVGVSRRLNRGRAAADAAPLSTPRTPHEHER